MLITPMFPVYKQWKSAFPPLIKTLGWLVLMELAVLADPLSLVRLNLLYFIFYSSLPSFAIAHLFHTVSLVNFSDKLLRGSQIG